jgi:hypothetical protein
MPTDPDPTSTPDKTATPVADVAGGAALKAKRIGSPVYNGARDARAALRKAGKKTRDAVRDSKKPII